VQQIIYTEPHYIDAPPSITAAFLVLTIKVHDASLSMVRSVLGSTNGLIKNITVRDTSGTFTCNVGLGHRVWAH
jgi:putative iron-dependent peroxidase